MTPAPITTTPPNAAVSAALASPCAAILRPSVVIVDRQGRAVVTDVTGVSLSAGPWAMAVPSISLGKGA